MMQGNKGRRDSGGGGVWWSDTECTTKAEGENELQEQIDT